MLQRFFIISFILFFILSVASSDGFTSQKSLTKTVLSDVYTIDKIYKSMTGPMSSQEIYLGNAEKEELIWVTGYETVMVDVDGKKILSEEFMCHSNLDFKLPELRQKFLQVHSTMRAFTLSQGQLSVKFPEGFGLPIVSSIPFQLYTQVLNLNHEKLNLQVRHKVTIDYLPQTHVKKVMVPLFTSSAYGMKGVTEGSKFYNQKGSAAEKKGSGCLMGDSATGSNFADVHGQKFTGHWVVPPGREVNHTYVTDIMALPYDTTIHYIAVHMHPFAQSLELIDRTTGESIFKSNVENTKNKIGLKRVEYFSSKEGIPVYKDHDYELISIYNNTTEQDHDSMAVMYLYLKDKEFSNYLPNF